jgi:hypothetical protein
VWQSPKMLFFYTYYLLYKFDQFIDFVTFMTQNWQNYGIAAGVAIDNLKREI